VFLKEIYICHILVEKKNLLEILLMVNLLKQWKKKIDDNNIRFKSKIKKDFDALKTNTANMGKRIIDPFGIFTPRKDEPKKNKIPQINLSSFVGGFFIFLLT
jgi:hypothetical protein